MQGQTFLQVLELDGAADLGKDGEGVRVPLRHDLAERDGCTVFNLDASAVDHGVAFFFASLFVDHRDRTLTVHHDEIADLGADGLESNEADGAVVLGVEPRLLADSRCRTADVEGTHRELRSRLADGLRRDHAGSFAQLDHASGGEVASVTGDANTALRFAGQHGADLDALDARGLDGVRQVLGDLVVHVYDHAAFVVLDLLERDAADDAVAQRLDDVAGFHDGTYVDAVERAAIVLADDHVLRHVDQAAGQVAGVGGLECRIRQALARAVRRDEVLQHREAFTEVCRDGVSMISPEGLEPSSPRIPESWRICCFDPRAPESAMT